MIQMWFDYDLVTDLFHEKNVGTTYDHVQLVQPVDWHDCGKSDIGYIIFKFDGRFFQLHSSRWGDYYHGYEYDFDTPNADGNIECREVMSKEVITIEWVKRG